MSDLFLKTLLIKVSVPSHLTISFSTQGPLAHFFWSFWPQHTVFISRWSLPWLRTFKLYIILSTFRTFHQWHKTYCYFPVRAVLSLAFPCGEWQGQSLDTKRQYCNMSNISFIHIMVHSTWLTELHPSLEQVNEWTLSGDCLVCCLFEYNLEWFHFSVALIVFFSPPKLMKLMLRYNFTWTARNPEMSTKVQSEKQWALSSDKQSLT